MKKKILILGIVGILLLTGVSGISTGKNLSKVSNENEIEVLNSHDLGKIRLHIGPPFDATVFLFIDSGAVVPSGEYKTTLEINFLPPPQERQIKGTWMAKVTALNEIFLNYVEIPFEYTDDNIPDNINEEFIFNIGKGYGAVTIEGSFIYSVNKWNEETGQWEFEDGAFYDSDIKVALDVTFPRVKTFNNTFVNFLQQHPNMFPILQHLLGI